MTVDRRVALAELRRREAQSAVQAQLAPRIRQALTKPLSPRQLAFFEDKADLVCVVAARQSGKTQTAIGIALNAVYERANVEIVFILPTRQRCKQVIWERLKKEAKSFGATDNDFNESELVFRTPAGSKIMLFGVPDLKRADVVRGMTLDLVFVDEALNFRPDVLQYLLEDCCEAALGKKRGRLIVMSTPAPNPEGYLWDLWQSPDIEASRYYLSIHDNPGYPDPDVYLARIRKKYAYTQATPRYRREWLGEWCADPDSLVYQVPDSAIIDEPPAYDHTVIGVDFGFKDASTYSVLGWRHGHNALSELETWGDSGVTLTPFAAKIRNARDRFKPDAIVADGAAKQSLEELNAHHDLYLEPVTKAPNYKALLIQQINDAFREGKLFVLRNSPLLKQMRVLQWAAGKHGIKEDQQQANDLADAFAYAFTCSSHYLETPDDIPPAVGSDEYWAQVNAEHKAELEQTRTYEDAPSWELPAHDPWDPL
jgi:hypothetical protein